MRLYADAIFTPVVRALFFPCPPSPPYQFQSVYFRAADDLEATQTSFVGSCYSFADLHSMAVLVGTLFACNLHSMLVALVAADSVDS